MNISNDVDRKIVIETSQFIRFCSVLYAIAVLTSGGWGLFLFLFFLPTTTFGIPFEIHFEAYDQGEWAFFPLLVLTFMLSIVTFWSGVEIRKFKKRGLYVYTGIVGLLTVGMIIDGLFRETLQLNIIGALLKGQAISIGVIVWILFLISVWRLWYRFKKLGLLKK